MFFRDTSRLKVKVIFHSSNSRLPEAQQMGFAELTPAHFRLSLQPNGKAPGLEVDTPLSSVRDMRFFHKKSYSSESYLVRVDYLEGAGEERMVCFEIRGFFHRRGALEKTMAWKDLYAKLRPALPGHSSTVSSGS